MNNLKFQCWFLLYRDHQKTNISKLFKETGCVRLCFRGKWSSVEISFDQFFYQPSQHYNLKTAEIIPEKENSTHNRNLIPLLIFRLRVPLSNAITAECANMLAVLYFRHFISSSPFSSVIRYSGAREVLFKKWRNERLQEFAVKDYNIKEDLWRLIEGELI